METLTVPLVRNEKVFLAMLEMKEGPYRKARGAGVIGDVAVAAAGGAAGGAANAGFPSFFLQVVAQPVEYPGSLFPVEKEAPGTSLGPCIRFVGRDPGWDFQLLEVEPGNVCPCFCKP